MSKALFTWLGLSLCTLGYLGTTNNPVLAQVTSDGTINTQVTENGNTAEITEGETRGDNLFHSFEDFSVETGNEAFFNNADSISNIFSRVTGGNVSDIDGAIRANGSANLFLINPAGIIFGENASLNIGGSFYGSSASSILFEDGEFSAADLDNPPLLTVNAPIGLGFRDNPQSITNRSQVNSGNGLQVDIGKNIFLIGGDINFDGGRITAPGGNVELGGLSAAGKIGSNNNGSLSFPDSVARSNVSLQNSSTVLVTSGGGGNIAVNARNLELQGGAFFAGIASGLGSPDAQAGGININATNNVSVDDQGGDSDSIAAISNSVGDSAIGNAGEINISARNISLNNGGSINAFVSGQGNGGDITLNARENISINGSNDTRNSVVVSFVFGEGNSGNANITAQNLTLSNGGNISSAVTGVGDSGNININAKDSLAVDGEAILADGTILPSKISSNVGFDAQGNPAKGNSGDISIKTSKLSLTNGGSIDTSTFGKGNAGNIKINSTESITLDGISPQRGSLSMIVSRVYPAAEGSGGNIEITSRDFAISNNANVDASTGGKGDAGSIDINATETVTLDKSGFISSLVAADAVGNSGALKITTPRLALTNSSAILATILGAGDAGNISINATDVVLTNDGTIDASSIGIGNGGSVFLKADTLSLNKGNIFAANIPAESPTENAAPKVGGNINLEIAKNLFLSNDSDITAQAGSNANGGNVDINANFIVAFPKGSNDIAASAQQGKGGNIKIASEGIFGIEERPLNELTNDINASSEFDLDGTININTSKIDPLQGTTELPSNVVEAKQTTEQTCSADREGKANNGLAIAGRGGVTPSPDAPLNSENISNENPPQASIPEPIETAQGKIQPARGIKFTKDGRIILTAYRTNNAGERIPEIQPNCN